MATSANSIYHYTPELAYLFNILRDGFYPSYCKEEIVLDSKTMKFAVPILSFCDLPLSQVKEDMQKYGEYAIGLNMEWAVRYGLNPVIYLEERSILNREMMNLLNFAQKTSHETFSEKKIEESAYKNYCSAISILQSLKNYKGVLERKEKGPQNVKFYDEREWRFTPQIHLSHSAQYPNIFFEVNFSRKIKMFSKKPHFKDYNVKIEIGDITYLIVSKDEEVTYLISHLKTVPHLFKNTDDFERLLTKIKTATQIKEDF
ncbi:MAG: abortive infection system antitoxin AbiGi family protein [Ferruginibacter sp.]